MYINAIYYVHMYIQYIMYMYCNNTVCEYIIVCIYYTYIYAHIVYMCCMCVDNVYMYISPCEGYTGSGSFVWDADGEA